MESKLDLLGDNFVLKEVIPSEFGQSNNSPSTGRLNSELALGNEDCLKSERKYYYVRCMNKKKIITLLNKLTNNKFLK